MSDRRYEVYEVRKCDCGCAASCCPNQHAESYALLDSAPDDLVEEAAKALYEAQLPRLLTPRASMPLSSVALARAALSVLFPGEEE